MGSPAPQTILRAAGLGACGLLALRSMVLVVYDRPVLVRGLPAPEEALVLGLLLLADLGLYGLFAAAFWRNTRHGPARRPTRSEILLLGLQVALCLALSPELLYVVAAEVPFLLSGRAAMVWMTVQSLAALGLCVLLIRDNSFVPIEELSVAPVFWRNSLTILALLAWQWFAFAAGWMVTCESRARTELARIHAELLAVQQSLADNSRMAERLHIARELHDSLGHHLAALTVNLQLASRSLEGPTTGAPAVEARATQAVHDAHVLARLLLGEVRDVVSALRDNRALDLPAALTGLAAGAVDIEVRLALDEGLEVRDPEQAHALFRCAQEALTNALKHGAARHLWIDLAADGNGGLTLRARDDGRGTAGVVAGHGLTGMRERLAELHGRLGIDSSPGNGFTLTAWLPRPSA